MSLKAIDFKELKAIVDWVNITEDVREFSLKFGDTELFISRNRDASPARAPLAAAPPAAVAAAPVSVAPQTAAAPQPAAVSSPASDASLGTDEVLIKAPMVGTFYASPKPGDPNFVVLGDTVSADSVLCIVEVMKLMNNIEAGVDGTVVKILVGNEQPVQYGQPLMIIKRSA